VGVLLEPFHKVRRTFIAPELNAVAEQLSPGTQGDRGMHLSIDPNGDDFARLDLAYPDHLLDAANRCG
jgi:hypothetical protein